MKILFVGEIVARPGRKVVAEVLPDILASDNIDLVVSNAENLAHGRGATEGTIEEMQKLGIDYFTGGDHLFWHKGFDTAITDLPVLRPANYPGDDLPGEGHKIVKTKKGEKVLLINLMGRTFLNERLDNPFTIADEILTQYDEDDYDVSVLDFHAEATSEKQALAFYLDGRVNSVVGSHTHVPTNDNRELPKGTLYVTDVGMSGNVDSVLGVKKEIIIETYLTAQRRKFDWELKGARAFRSVLIDTTDKKISRIDKYVYD